VLRHNDEPLNTPTWLVHWMLMEKARRLDLPVLLDGTGGDELLAGYHPHHLLMLADLEESGDGSFRHELTAWCARVGTTEQSYRDAKPRFGRLRGPLLRDVDPDIVFMTSGSRPDGAGKAVRLLDRRSAATSAVRREFAVAHPILLSRPNPMWNKGLLKAQLYQEITAEAIPAALRPADRSSMAFGVEIRSPFLDHRLVEFSLGLPGRFSIRDGVNKWLLREGMTGKMPEVVRTRADKQGMNVPSTRWLRGPWKDRVRSVLASDAVKDHRILNQTEVLRRFDEHVAGEGNHYLDIWHWYNLELWLREHEVNR
jgi:asparagine synthase (glutamine-hydrolysing)